jgi:baculoviral IAP repeat-containing protein 6
MTEETINNWIKESGVELEYSLKNNQIDLKINGVSFSLVVPKNQTEYFIIHSVDKRYNWIYKLNLYCAEKNPDLSKLLTRLKSYVEKEEKSSKSNLIIKETSLLFAGGDSIENYDLEIYKMQKKIEEFAATSKSQLNTSVDKKNQLYTKSAVSKIVSGEFLDTLKKYKNSSKIKIELVGNNIYHWKVKFFSFNNAKLNAQLKNVETKFGYNWIEVDLHFHDELYPSYPPQVNVIRPRLNNNLMHRIPNSKMVNIEYWTPVNDSNYVIEKIFKTLDKWAEINVTTEMNDMKKYKDGSYMKLESHLVKLASFVDVQTNDEIDDEKYIKVKDLLASGKSDATTATTAKIVGAGKTYWKAGTGYGHGGSKTWDIENYVKTQEERDKQIQNIIRKITIELQDIDEKHMTDTYETLVNSYLLKYVRSQLGGTTLLDISRHNILYKDIFNLIGLLASENSIHLFGIYGTDESKNLFECLEGLNKLSETAIKINTMSSSDTGTKDEFVDIISNLYSMVKPCYESYVSTRKELIDKKIKKIDTSITNTVQQTYKDTMQKYVFDMADIANGNYNTPYKTLLASSKGDKPKYQKRLTQEFTALEESLPVYYDSSIFVRLDNANMSVVRALITGPKDTPYENGCMIFDIYVPSTYPSTSPNVWYMTTGGKRFNPNLYAEGKVCLSLLGTWSGVGSETWNPTTSTIYQVLMSIQSQILIDEPYFNEPGHESTIGSASGTSHSKAYNMNIRYYTMCHTILDLLKNPKAYPQFEDVIRDHFKLKKDSVIATCQKWTDEASLTFKPQYETTLAEIKKHLENLK